VSGSPPDVDSLSPSIRIALHQADTVVGAIESNAGRFVEALASAEAAGAALLAGPELAVTGYPPEDLLLKPGFVADNLAAVQMIAGRTQRCVALVGFVDVVDDRPDADADASVGGGVDGRGGAGVDAGAVPDSLDFSRAARASAMRGEPRRLRNAVAVCAGGAVRAVYHKRLLPNYGVFDEARWFAPGAGSLSLYGVGGMRLGVSICEDLWLAEGPVPALGRGGAQLIVNVNASPFAIGRAAERRRVLQLRAAEAGCPIVYVNQVGGQDELVFDGGSLVVDPAGAEVAAAGRFAEELLIVDVPVAGPTAVGGQDSALPCLVVVEPDDQAPVPNPAPVALPAIHRLADRWRGPLAEDDDRQCRDRAVPARETEAEVYDALVLGTRDYLAKNGFDAAVIGLSGGIDSSLVAAVAVDALGADRVHGIAMPSRYSSESSVVDAQRLAGALGIDLQIAPIEPAHVAFAGLLGGLGVVTSGLTDENLQSRLRGVLLMAVSNARGWLVLTTGNKSELATGYSTLYGDTAGGFAVIKDVPKTLVYRLCRYRNAMAGSDVVPDNVLRKPPSAELRPDQRDDQSLPPYDVLDPVLAALVEDDLPLAAVVAMGADPALVQRVAHLVDVAEYKRRQSPIGIRITPRAFGKDRRMPITHQYRERLAEPAPARP